MSSPDAEALICRYLNGDLSLFVLEHWLRSGQDLAPGLHERLLGLIDRPEQLEAALLALVPPGRPAHHLLLQILPWLLSDEPRAGRAVLLCHQLCTSGLTFLAPIGAALAEGETATGFDWERVKAAVPELQPAAKLILHLLESGELQLGTGDGAYKLSETYAPLLEAGKPWREANRAIVAWSEEFQHLLPEARA